MDTDDKRDSRSRGYPIYGLDENEGGIKTAPSQQTFLLFRIALYLIFVQLPGGG